MKMKLNEEELQILAFELLRAGRRNDYADSLMKRRYKILFKKIVDELVKIRY